MAVLVSVGSYALFKIALGVSLPRGLITLVDGIAGHDYEEERFMDALTGLFYGFGIVLQPQNLLFCFIGCFVGTLVGVLPGLGPGGALALLLPITFALSPATAIIMLAGIYYGAMYGGSTTSILINIPGEAASVITCLDGYQMARKGRAGPALGMAAIGSFIAGTISLVRAVVPGASRLRISP